MGCSQSRTNRTTVVDTHSRRNRSSRTQASSQTAFYDELLQLLSDDATASQRQQTSLNDSTSHIRPMMDGDLMLPIRRRHRPRRRRLESSRSDLHLHEVSHMIGAARGESRFLLPHHRSATSESSSTTTRMSEMARDESRLAEIVALQQSLAAMEDFFESLLGQAQFFTTDMMDPGGHPGPPPASKPFVESLKEVECAPNSVCPICNESMENAIRLPCGHEFHGEHCLHPWLERHCTCPVCRYEVPTDDASFEQGRLERMSQRASQLGGMVSAFKESEAAAETETIANTTTATAATAAPMIATASNSEQGYDTYDADESEREDPIPEYASCVRNTGVAATSHYDADESSVEETTASAALGIIANNKPAQVALPSDPEDSSV